MLKICEICNKKFEITKRRENTARFCSCDCRDFEQKKSKVGNQNGNWRGGKIKKNCLVCGEEFKVAVSVNKNGGGKYCSNECYHSSHKGVKNHFWKGGKIKRNCLVCEKEFFVTPSTIKMGKGKYCSYKCFHFSLRGKKLSEETKRRLRIAHPAAKKIKRICLFCGKEFLIALRCIERGGGKYCSYKCAQRASVGREVSEETRKKIGEKSRGRKFSEVTRRKMSDARKGAKSKFWKGGVTQEMRKRFNSFDWHLIRRKVYARDNWTCKICGKKCNEHKGRIQCHHIIPYRIAPNNSESNLITLCINCHSRVETRPTRMYNAGGRRQDGLGT